MGGIALLGDHVPAREGGILQPLGDIGLLRVRQRRQDRHRIQHLQPAGQFAFLHRLGMCFVALHGVHRVLRLGDADVGALQRREEVHAHHRVGRVVFQQIGEEVAQLVAQVAVFEAEQHAGRNWGASHVGNGELAHLVFDDRDDPRRRHARVDHEIEDAPPLAGRAFAPPEDGNARLHERAVGYQHGLPVARLDQRRAPADVAHPPGELVDAHPVAHLNRVVELDGEAAEHIAQRVLHRERDDRGEDRRGRHKAAEVHSGAAQLNEAVAGVGDQDRNVLEDARGPLPCQRQQQAE